MRIDYPCGWSHYPPECLPGCNCTSSPEGAARREEWYEKNPTHGELLDLAKRLAEALLDLADLNQDSVDTSVLVLLDEAERRGLIECWTAEEIVHINEEADRLGKALGVCRVLYDKSNT